MTDQVTVRHVEPERIADWSRSIRSTFLEDPDGVSQARTAWGRRHWDTDRVWGAFDARDQIVGTLRTLPRRLSVPGVDCATNDIAADALTAVTVAATHRRRGLLRTMLGQSLTQAKERGDPVSILIAAEWPIYGRFGYWPAATWHDLTLDRTRPGATLLVPTTGIMRACRNDDYAELAFEVFTAARTQRAAQIDRPRHVWELNTEPSLRPTGDKGWTGVVHEGPDGVDGVLRWHPVQEFGWHAGGKIAVDDLFATNQDAYTALWGYLLGMDVVASVEIAERPTDEPIRWLLADARALKATLVLDSLWVRLLDVPAALSARSYSVPGRLSLEVIDEDFGGFAAGRYVLDGRPDGAECRRAPERTPDLRLSQRALAAVYLGQPSLRGLAVAGLVQEVTPGTLQLADAMFATALTPWAGTSF